jgi:hypothetical protein
MAVFLDGVAGGGDEGLEEGVDVETPWWFW